MPEVTCVSCGKRPATGSLDFRDGGEIFATCGPCAQEAAGRIPGAALTPELDQENAAQYALWQAESLVSYEWHCEQATRMLSTEALRLVIWVGLLDEGWSRVHRELGRRGEEL